MCTQFSFQSTEKLSYNVIVQLPFQVPVSGQFCMHSTLHLLYCFMFPIALKVSLPADFILFSLVYFSFNNVVFASQVFMFQVYPGAFLSGLPWLLWCLLMCIT